jgi:membrane-bound lytic murein transglycosylase B
MMRLLLTSLIAGLVLALPAKADPKFEAFIQNTIWPQVKAAGISRSLFDAGFAGITEPDQAVLNSRQPLINICPRL